MESDGVEVAYPKRQTYTDIFKELCPYYMSIGMSYEQFWFGDPEMVIYYRKAHEYRNKQKNQELWWAGVYVQQALLSTVGNMFSKKGAEPIHYPREPLPTTEEEAREYQEREQKNKYLKMLNAMKARASNDIPRDAKREGEKDEHTD